MRFLSIALMIVGHATGESVYNFGTRVEGAVFHFEFPHEECELGSFEDGSGLSLFGNLSRNMDTTSCNDGLGVSLMNYFEAGASQVTSEHNSTHFIAKMDGRTNYTLEIWKQSGVNDDASNPIASPVVTIGAIDDTEDNTCTEPGGTHNTYNLQLYETQLLVNGAVSLEITVPLFFTYIIYIPF